MDVGDREIGPLEQLFGARQPIILDSSSPQILVVAPIQRTREIAQNLDLFGTATADVVPTAHIRREEDGFDVTPWSKHGIGGEPTLCVVRSVDEAYEYILSQDESNTHSVASVIAPARRDSADASQIARIGCRRNRGAGVCRSAGSRNSRDPRSKKYVVLGLGRVLVRIVALASYRRFEPPPCIAV